MTRRRRRRRGCRRTPAALLLFVFTTQSFIEGMPGSAASVDAQPAPAGAIADESLISVRLDTLTFLAGKKGDIEVLQLLRVMNSGQVPYQGEPLEGEGGSLPAKARMVFRIPVPEGAFDVAPSDLRNPQGMAEGPAGIYSTVPLPPGETLISLIYRVRPARTGWALRREIEYPTRSINLLVGPGLEIQDAPGFELAERKTLGNVEYRRFRAGPFSPGSVLTADVGFGGEPPSHLWPWFATAAATAAAAGLGLTLYFRRRSAGPPANQDRPAREPEPRRRVSREELVLQIAALDEEFDAGSVPEAAYRTRREQLKQRLAPFSET